MAKLFNKIRKQLVSDKPSATRTANYLKYAIGEIILVVIGILIAIAVAEWNSNRRDIKTEHRLLNELKQGVTKDLTSIEAELKKTNTSITNLKQLDSLLNLPIPQPNEKLNVLFGDVYGIRFLKLNKALYEDLKSVGFGIIQDEKLRTQIILVFENNYSDISGILENERSINKVIRLYYLNNFVSIQFSRYAKPKDMQTLWKDSYYKNIVYYRMVTLESNQLGIYESAISQIKLLLELIEQNISF